MSNLGPGQFQYKIRDRVSFDLGSMKGAGMVLGRSIEGIVDLWIILLDEELPTHLAITVPSPLMKLISRQ